MRCTPISLDGKEPASMWKDDETAVGRPAGNRPSEGGYHRAGKEWWVRLQDGDNSMRFVVGRSGSAAGSNHLASLG
jgi:hypothetical protein